MHKFKANFDKILSVLKFNCNSLFDKNGNFGFKIKKPKFSDIELSAMIITAEFLGIDSEAHLFRMLDNTEFANKIERSVYNKRKRIETLFSQLCDQFMICRNYAKSFEGFKTRIIAKVTAMTTIQFINKFVFNRNINTLKTIIT